MNDEPTMEEKDNARKAFIAAGFNFIDADELVGSDSFWFGMRIAEKHIKKAFATKKEKL